MPVVTVSQLNNYMRRYLDNNSNLNGLYVKGEISNFKRHSSGHMYFTLKDSGSVLKCVMFKSDASFLGFEPSDGMKVIALGRVSVYEAGGLYQLYAEQILPDGKGELYAAYEQLKATLEQQGYFDSFRKKALPYMPSSIGIVTAPGGAAIRDILSILQRRFPMTEVIIYPAIVQGPEASDTIVSGIEYFNKKCNTDLIIIGRGGGSIEDLWAFNERKVANSIYNSRIPIISAVGHETDFTISDFVADMRAPTPSAAAEMAVPDCRELLKNIEKHKNNLVNSLKNSVKIKRNKFENITKTNLKEILEKYLNDKKIYIDDMQSDLDLSFSNIIKNKKNTYITACAKLETLSPVKVLLRGYSVAENNEKIITSVNDVKKGDDITITVSDGKIYCKTEDTDERCI